MRAEDMNRTIGINDRVKIRRVVIEPAVFLGVRDGRVRKQELRFRPDSPTVVRQRDPNLGSITHPIHLSVQPCVLRLNVAIVME